MLTDTIYTDLRKKILNLTMKPGTPLSFANLKPLYNVSISPIRDALKILASEGLVEIRPQSGTYVSLIDFSKVEDERFERLYLELGAIEIASDIYKLAPDMQKLIEEQEKAFNCRDIISFLSLDDCMHSLFFKACNHQRVFDSQLQSNGNYHRIRMVSYMFDNIVQDTIIQHKQLLKAVVNNDKQKLLALDRLHISRIQDEIITYQTTYPAYFK